MQESRVQVSSVIKNAGLMYPRRPLTVNLAQAAVRKEGPAYDLPIALGVLLITAQLPPNVMDGCLVIGELSLDGSVQHVRGMLPMATARAQGSQTVFGPRADAMEAALIPDLEVIAVCNLAELINHLRGVVRLQPCPPVQAEDLEISVLTDFREITGQEHVKRTLEVAAAISRIKAKFSWHTAGCCSWMNCRSSIRAFWRCCASRWRTRW